MTDSRRQEIAKLTLSSLRRQGRAVEIDGDNRIHVRPGGNFSEQEKQALIECREQLRALLDQQRRGLSWRAWRLAQPFAYPDLPAGESHHAHGWCVHCRRITRHRRRPPEPWLCETCDLEAQK